MLSCSFTERCLANSFATRNLYGAKSLRTATARRADMHTMTIIGVPLIAHVFILFFEMTFCIRSAIDDEALSVSTSTAPTVHDGSTLTPTSFDRKAACPSHVDSAIFRANFIHACFAFLSSDGAIVFACFFSGFSVVPAASMSPSSIMSLLPSPSSSMPPSPLRDGCPRFLFRFERAFFVASLPPTPVSPPISLPPSLSSATTGAARNSSSLPKSSPPMMKLLSI
mmetsp:Transcript_23754/g.67140  ORF Transcript_23754/g.67140 Transcript_23754/m.67140 type:complete len:225 (+) Transcript_23754:311-985(+)